MATIYRFIIENRESGGASSGGRKAGLTGSAKKGAGKKGTSSFFGGERGGVEHNRRMRAINPLLNKVTNGYWEQGMRVGRAGLGLAKNIEEKGVKGALVGPSIAIIIAWAIQTFLKLQNKNLEWGKQRNEQNYKQMENGVSAVHGAYSVERNFWSGRRTFNENK